MVASQRRRPELDRLTAMFGHESVVVELIDHGFPTDSVDNDALAALAADHGLPIVATNNVHYAKPATHQLAAAIAAVRARRSLSDMDGWLPTSSSAHLRSGAEMLSRFARYPGAVQRSVDDRRRGGLRPARGHPQAASPGHTRRSYRHELAP